LLQDAGIVAQRTRASFPHRVDYSTVPVDRRQSRMLSSRYASRKVPHMNENTQSASAAASEVIPGDRKKRRRLLLLGAVPPTPVDKASVKTLAHAMVDCSPDKKVFHCFPCGKKVEVRCEELKPGVGGKSPHKLKCSVCKAILIGSKDSSGESDSDSNSVEEKHVVSLSDSNFTRSHCRTRWKRGVLAKVRPMLRVMRPPRRASLLDRPGEPGWAARLVLMLGQGSTSAKPLACTSRRFACCLLRDALQLVSLLRPTALALARIDMWGESEERDLVQLRESTCMLVALADLSSSLALGPASSREFSRATSLRAAAPAKLVATAAEAEATLAQVRLQRVGCLLSKLASDVEQATMC
jgi:hypothetical protein